MEQERATIREVRLLSARPRLAAFRDALSSSSGRFRESEFRIVGESRRFRAVQRRRTRSASRAGFLVIAAAVAFDGIALVGFEEGHPEVALAFSAVTMALALGGWWLLARALRHHPEPTAWVVTMGAAVTTAATGLAVPSTAVQSVGYLVVLPGLVALVLPWRTRTHLRWLLGYAVVIMGYLAFDRTGSFTPSERSDLVIVLLIALAASLTGHVLLARSQVRSFAQLESIRMLRRQSDADRNEIERAHRVLELSARTDPLTGAGNRLRLKEDLRGVRARIARSRVVYGFVEIDLDRFKAINDRFGHGTGDDVLQQTVAAIQKNLRAEDAVYRMGGDEFLVVMSVATIDGLRAASERLRRVVLDRAIAHPANPPHGVVSISIGATLIGPNDLDLSDEQWIARADEALYAAKAAGRNRVHLGAAR